MVGRISNRNSIVPPWPELDARQKREALAATWLPRLVEGLAGAAALAAMTAFLSYEAMGGLGWRTAASAVLAVAFFGAFLFVRDRREPGPWIAPLGLATILLTELNLVNCVIGYLNAQDRALGLPDPAYVLAALVAGTMWALRVHLSMEGFVWAAGITAATLWLPWVSLMEAPVEFCLIGAACVAAGALMRSVGAERAYDAYRRETVWPGLWRKRLDLAVARELVALGAIPAQEAVRASTDERGEISVLRLAAALARKPSEPDLAESIARSIRRAGSQA